MAYRQLQREVLVTPKMKRPEKIRKRRNNAMEQDAFVFPASFAQQRLWFLDQLDPATSVYNIPAAWRLRGPLNRAALAHSLSEIVRRHEALRTTFAAADGQPVQVIAPAVPLALPVMDLQAV